ncbi:hypothetical protein [uncultured Imperialibacter sp.]|uniref:hypothetical protein n=1 Tax=uncultured Imperialibacter sp. TaxID=1672639 RepID=UPI0030D6F4FC|tara:strand:+ start:1084 stop:1728 length:645 start_codon:yes stop_codon:yes gene_type:complete
MLRYFFYSLVTTLFLIGFTCHSQPQWTVLEELNGITLYESDQKCDTLRNFMAVFTVPASVKTCVNILYNNEFHTDFMDGMKSSELIKYHHEKSLVFYQVIDLPWPIPNRDMVTLATFEHTPDFKTVTVNLRSSPDEKAPTSMTRVNVPEREWSFSKNGELSTHVTYTYRTNPSHFPSLLEDTFTIDGPMKMMSGFKDLATKESRTPVNLVWIRD